MFFIFSSSYLIFLYISVEAEGRKSLLHIVVELIYRIEGGKLYARPFKELFKGNELMYLTDSPIGATVTVAIGLSQGFIFTVKKDVIDAPGVNANRGGSLAYFPARFKPLTISSKILSVSQKREPSCLTGWFEKR